MERERGGKKKGKEVMNGKRGSADEVREGRDKVSGGKRVSNTNYAEDNNT